MIDNAQKYAGGEFTLFVAGGGRVQIGDFLRIIEEVAIEIPALPRPTLAELRAKFSWIKAEGGIDRDTSPTEAVTLRLATVLRLDEPSIGGEEYERRIAPTLDVMLGYQHRQWLIEHQMEYPALMALLGKVYIDFPGLIVVREDGNRFCPYLTQDGKRFDEDWDWMSYVLNRNGRIALSGK